MNFIMNWSYVINFILFCMLVVAIVFSIWSFIKVNNIKTPDVSVEKISGDSGIVVSSNQVNPIISLDQEYLPVQKDVISFTEFSVEFIFNNGQEYDFPSSKFPKKGLYLIQFTIKSTDPIVMVDGTTITAYFNNSPHSSPNSNIVRATFTNLISNQTGPFFYTATYPIVLDPSVVSSFGYFANTVSGNNGTVELLGNAVQLC
jgi:hypothetical protein